MAETLQTGTARSVGIARSSELGRATLVGAVQVAHDTEVRQSPNGVHFATFGETGLADLDLDRMLQAVPSAIVAALNANTYYFVPLALREANETPGQLELPDTAPKQPTMVASAWTDELSYAAICHRNVDLPHGKRGVFISTRLMGDRFALSFEFFINVAHAFVDQTGVPQSFTDLVWQQALADTRGETSFDAWESRNLALGRPANFLPEPAAPTSRRNRSFTSTFSARQRSFGTAAANTAPTAANVASAAINEKDRMDFLEAAFSDAVAIYLLSLALDIDYSELREREYPLLAPQALAARLRLVATLFPPNPDYEFAVRYRRKA